MNIEISQFWSIILTVTLLVLPVIALTHMHGRQYKGRNKLIWVLIILFLPFFGALLYFILGKKYRRENPLD